MTNRLAAETSPYLRQHADNPVDWYPWGDEAFGEARASGRPLLLSIGYSACHWCHVMAHESFEDPETAALMNRLFVNVKVDREERPDVDAIYMEATQAMTGHGGWPMTVFLDHDGAPFYCATYVPKVRRGPMPAFTELCAAIDDAWHHRRGEIDEQAGRLTEYLRRSPDLTPRDRGDGGAAVPLPPDLAVLDDAARRLLDRVDPRWGGFGTAPKFPHSMSIDLLLRRAARADDDLGAAALAGARRCLDGMAAGGIHDHVGGGFARYSVDERWLVPHFEKMLYDNALLIRPYLHAWQLTGHEPYRRVVDDTVAYLLRDLRHPDGGFFSAEDADSLDTEGHSAEGAFYVWSLDDVRDVVTAAAGADTADRFAAAYGVTAGGNFEGASILLRSVGDFGDDGSSPAERDAFAAARSALLDRRAGRPRPGLDDKVLTEWNGLLLASLAEAAVACDRHDWLVAAEEQAEFLCRRLRRDDGRWLRSWQAEGGARHLAYAHDYAALVDGFTRLYEATGALRWLDEARSAADGLLDLFADEEHGGLFTTGSDADPLLTRPKDLMDNATPSAVSLAAVALTRLAALGDAAAPSTERFRDAARRVVDPLARVAAENPLAFSHLLAAVELDVGGSREVVITGDRPDLLAVVRSSWRPDVVVAWGERSTGSLWDHRDDGFAFVCEGHACRQPVATVEDLEGQLA